MHLLSEHAKEIAAIPGWEPYSFEVLRNGSERPATAYHIIGAIPRILTRGPRKGKMSWNKSDPASKRDIYISVAEHDEWCRDWSLYTGKCIHCVGNGKRVASVTADGVTYRECSKCKGTGLRQDPD